MNSRLSAPEWIHRVATLRDSAPIYSKPYKWLNPRLLTSVPLSSVSCIRGLQLDAIVPRLSNCSANSKTAGQIAPATSQLSHSHR
jgi:hypothetical protein